MEQTESTEIIEKMEKIDLGADQCLICYKTITNSVVLECKHQMCLLCVVSILKATKKELYCPLCRKCYAEIFMYKKKVKVPEPESIPYEIGIVKRYAHRLDEIVRDKFNTDDFDSYDIFIFHGEDDDYKIEMFIVRDRETIYDLLMEDIIWPHKESLAR